MINKEININSNNYYADKKISKSSTNTSDTNYTNINEKKKIERLKRDIKIKDKVIADRNKAIYLFEGVLQEKENRIIELEKKLKEALAEKEENNNKMLSSMIDDLEDNEIHDKSGIIDSRYNIDNDHDYDYYNEDCYIDEIEAEITNNNNNDMISVSNTDYSKDIFNITGFADDKIFKNNHDYVKEFICNSLNKTTPTITMNSEFYKQLSPDNQLYADHLIQDYFYNNNPNYDLKFNSVAVMKLEKNPFARMNAKINNINNESRISKLKITESNINLNTQILQSNVIVFRDESDRNSICYISKVINKKKKLTINTYFLHIICLDTKNIIQEISLKEKEISEEHNKKALYHYKSVLDLSTIKDFIIIVSEIHTKILHLLDDKYTCFKNISHSSEIHEVFIIPSIKMDRNLLFYCRKNFNYNDYILVNELEKPQETNTSLCSIIEEKYFKLFPYFYYNNHSDSEVMYVVKCLRNKVILYIDDAPYYHEYKKYSLKIESDLEEQINNVVFIEDDFDILNKYLYCSSKTNSLFVFDFTTTKLIKKIKEACSYIQHFSGSYLIGNYIKKINDGNKTENSIIIFDIKTKKVCGIRKLTNKNIPNSQSSNLSMMKTKDNELNLFSMKNLYMYFYEVNKLQLKVD